MLFCSRFCVMFGYCDFWLGVMKVSGDKVFFIILLVSVMFVDVV